MKYKLKIGERFEVGCSCINVREARRNIMIKISAVHYYLVCVIVLMMSSRRVRANKLYKQCENYVLSR